MDASPPSLWDPPSFLPWRAGAPSNTASHAALLGTASKAFCFFLLESKITRFMDMIFFLNLTNTTNAFSRVFEALTLHGLLSFGKENLEKPCWVCRAEESL